MKARIARGTRIIVATLVVATTLVVVGSSPAAGQAAPTVTVSSAALASGDQVTITTSGFDPGPSAIGLCKFQVTKGDVGPVACQPLVEYPTALPTSVDLRIPSYYFLLSEYETTCADGCALAAWRKYSEA